MAADSLVEAARAAAEARTSTSSSSSMDDTTRPQQQQHQVTVQNRLDASRRVGLNPSNVIIKSFADVAMADLELVFPSKKVRALAVYTLTCGCG